MPRLSKKAVKRKHRLIYIKLFYDAEGRIYRIEVKARIKPGFFITGN
jgi:hypothetical protein